jgi:hypothetical protein
MKTNRVSFRDEGALAVGATLSVAEHLSGTVYRCEEYIETRTMFKECRSVTSYTAIYRLICFT